MKEAQVDAITKKGQPMTWDDLAVEIAKMPPEKRKERAQLYFFNPALGDEGYYPLKSELQGDPPALQAEDEIMTPDDKL